jgi:hypothetical protein
VFLVAFAEGIVAANLAIVVDLIGVEVRSFGVRKFFAAAFASFLFLFFLLFVFFATFF